MGLSGIGMFRGPSRPTSLPWFFRLGLMGGNGGADPMALGLAPGPCLIPMGPLFPVEGRGYGLLAGEVSLELAFEAIPICRL